MRGKEGNLPVKGATMKSLSTLLFTIFLWSTAGAQVEESACDKADTFWELGSDYNMYWNVEEEKRLPHQGQFEVGGAKIHAVIRYTVDEQRSLHLSRKLAFPDLLPTTQFSPTFIGEGQPKIFTGEVEVSNAPLATISIDGNITFIHQPVDGIVLERKLFAAPHERLFVEYWEVKNLATITRNLTFQKAASCIQSFEGKERTYGVEVTSDVRPDITLEPNEMYRFAVYYAAKIDGEAPPVKDAEFAWMERVAFLQNIGEQAVLVTPEPAFNMAFELAKIKAAEKGLVKEVNDGTIQMMTDRIQYFSTWIREQLISSLEAALILEGLHSDRSAEARSSLVDYTCQQLLGKGGPNLPQTFYTARNAQGALYCQLFTKGIWGITQTDDYGVIRCRPKMPSGWKEMELQGLQLFGEKVNFRLRKSRRYRDMYYFYVVKDGLVIYRKRIQSGRSMRIRVAG